MNYTRKIIFLEKVMRESFAVLYVLHGCYFFIQCIIHLFPMWKQNQISVIFASSLPGRSKWYTWKSRNYRVWLVAVKNSIAGEISYRLNAHGDESVFFYVKLKWSRWDSFKLFLLYLFKGKMSKRNNFFEKRKVLGTITVISFQSKWRTAMHKYINTVHIKGWPPNWYK